MIAKFYIERNLKKLDSMIRKPNQGVLVPQMYSKLAIIEVGGWTEMTMDDLIQRATKKATSQKYITDKIIKPIYGFSYDEHFRKMLIQAIGIVTVDQVESQIDSAKFQRLRAALGNLKTARDGMAHTYVKDTGTTTSISAPSVTITYFHNIYAGLKEIELVMRNMRLL